MIMYFSVVINVVFFVNIFFQCDCHAFFLFETNFQFNFQCYKFILYAIFTALCFFIPEQQTEFEQLYKYHH